MKRGFCRMTERIVQNSLGHKTLSVGLSTVGSRAFLVAASRYDKL